MAYVQLDGNGNVVGMFGGAQNPPTPPGYAVIADTDPRIATFQQAQAKPQQAAQLVAAGVQIVSTGTPALNGTYAIDDSAKAVIDGIYAGIKNGDGLPGGGTTFNYPDIAGTFHAFDAISFPNFAKKTRDYLYSISQGTPLAQPVSIP